MTLKAVGEHSQVFVFGGVVVGGMDAAVTTLVSAHARRIAADPNLLRRHLRTQEVPLAAAGTSAEQTAPAESAPSMIRAFVVGERVCASLLRLPAAVLGDGSSTLNQLIQADVEARTRHALLAGTAVPVTPDRGTPTVQEQLSRRGLTTDQVPALHELVQLQDSAEIRRRRADHRRDRCVGGRSA